MSRKHSVVRLEQHGVTSAPLGWMQSRVKYLGDYVNGYPFKPADWGTSGRPILRIQDLSSSNAEPNRYDGEIPGRYLVRRGDILISWSASLGVYRWRGEESWLNQHIFKVALNNRLVRDDYFVWLAEWFINEMDREVHGSTMQHLTADAFGGFPVLLPPHEQQRAIADYLDRETARLDALVAAKERVLGLLAEKRRALITRGVTRGLDPCAPFRDSGIPWLGEIPAHWETRKLRYACEAIQTGGTPSAEFVDDLDEGAVNWFTPGDFAGTLELALSARKVTQDAMDAGEARLFPAGTVFVVGIGATLGKVGFIVKPASANQQINALIPRRQMDSRFLAYLLTLLGDVMNISANSATLPILNQQRMGEIAVTLPSLEEQHALVRWIDEKSAKLEGTHKATERTIALLKERRAALIAAAVTGKIDVRKHAKQHGAPHAPAALS